MAADRARFYYRITAGIRITVRPSYLSERSNPLLSQFVFAYHIRIENIGDQASQLRTRRWLISRRLPLTRRPCRHCLCDLNGPWITANWMMPP